MSIAIAARGRKIKKGEEDQGFIAAILDRAVEELVTLFLRGDIFDLASDIAICHRRYRLDLEGLAAAGKDEFAQEIILINHNINRKTGRFSAGFLPRHLKRKGETHENKEQG
jgi:hypothetical protein